MKAYRLHFRWNMKTKLIVLSALFTVSSVFLVSSLSYLRYTRDFEQQSAGKIQQIIEQVSLNINSYVDDLFRLSLAPYRNDSLMRELEDGAASSEVDQLEKRRLIEGFLDEMMIYPRQDIIQVFILADEIYTSGRNPRSINGQTDFHTLDWYRKALSTQNPFFVPTHTQDLVGSGAPQVFSIVRQLRSTRNTEKVLGVIKVDANYSGVAAICSKVNMGQEGGLFIIDKNKNLIYSNVTRLDPLAVYEQVVKEFGHSSFRMNRNSYLINSIYLPSADWTIVTVNSVRELNKSATLTRNYAFYSAIACSLLAILVLFYACGKFLRPLLRVVGLMHKVENGQLNVRFDEQRKDEIGYLGSSFNSLVSQIRVMLEENTQLVKEVYESKLLQKEAQINALYNQIRPHFIFNTLNMISLLMQTGEQAKAVDHINKLSSILRSMFSWDKNIPLQREVELLDAYLGIQSSRYQGRLDYDIDIPSHLYAAHIPALLLQPVVENAVIHGCENKRERTLIRIFCRMEDQGVTFVVEDTGQGMDTETLANLREKLDTAEAQEVKPSGRSGSGIGLVNVNQRIKWNYGSAYGLHIESAPGLGTRVEIRLPAIV
jgi:two-component system sensor histidine kinase YesM